MAVNLDKIVLFTASIINILILKKVFSMSSGMTVVSILAVTLLVLLRRSINCGHSFNDAG